MKVVKSKAVAVEDKPEVSLETKEVMGIKTILVVKTVVSISTNMATVIFMLRQVDSRSRNQTLM